MGSRELIAYFDLLVCAALLYLLNYLYLTHEISHFYLSDALFHPSVGN